MGESRFVSASEAVGINTRSFSTHGIRRVGWSVQWWAKIFWVIGFFFGLFGFFYLAIKLIEDYNSYPVKTLLSRESGFQTFPAITLCSQNPISKDPSGADVRKFILFCTYDTKICDIKKDFKPVYNNYYGQCYTFNANKSGIRTSVEAGPTNGLYVILNPQINEITTPNGLKDSSDGVRLALHRPGRSPNLQLNGISVPLKAQVLVGVDHTIFDRLGSPYGECTDSDISTCEMSCLQNKIKSQCSCVDPSLPLPTSVSGNVCSLGSSCPAGVIKSYTEGKFKCNCDKPCSETRYQVDVTEAQWPAKMHEATLQNLLKNNNGKRFELHRLSSISIFYKKLEKSIHKEEIAHTLLHFMTQLGGISALFIGLSFLGIFECCDMGISVFFAGSNPKRDLSKNDQSLNHGGNGNGPYSEDIPVGIREGSKERMDFTPERY